jgi:hypothetical protein
VQGVRFSLLRRTAYESTPSPSSPLEPRPPRRPVRAPARIVSPSRHPHRLAAVWQPLPAVLGEVGGEQLEPAPGLLSLIRHAAEDEDFEHYGNDVVVGPEKLAALNSLTMD